MADRALIILGTRGSDLARAQARQVEGSLRAAALELAIETKIIVTSGDEGIGSAGEPVDRRAGRKGLFTREIERALRDGKIDIAVHSAKDLPSETGGELQVRAALKRAEVDDVFIAKERGGFASVRAGAVIATGSVRRQHQLRASNADITTVDLRGNVPTRLRKLIASDWDGIILARAGIERLGLSSAAGVLDFEGTSLFVESLPQTQFLPAGGQGIIALQVRADDERTKRVVDLVNDRVTLLCLRAEREFLRLLQGDCDSPVGVLAVIQSGNEMQIRVQVFEFGATTARVAETSAAVDKETPERIAAELMEKLNGR
ncbi:MAG: hydroxymethylbilane synthase [Verrucomicrobiota bacterium]|nr:hydroxymethylbilane synthase [Verrucomicrobiota bacterium]